jgi:5-methylcytosine-specific restriction endonuclease McrA
MAKGLCHHCYFVKYAKTNVDKLRDYKHEWYLGAGGALRARILREQQNYSGMRTPVLERDGYQCTKCGRTESLLVHHKDGKGRGHKKPNNSMSNLTTLCMRCHINHHRPQLMAGRKKKKGIKP